ncbi:amidohydrolase family protein [Heliorestis convoluta]|uniref:N-acyl-d-aspartate/d-glutamate deacylase, putative n=1 Tax=Heliorestis convoluta TaxID=356322 RepID=A0A5Q2MY83_9FIRM|nr:amidohydrolase family protein [Heliorestis convoluta]QGG47587.1 N-acyl-d-aspartate/d-glutamate deacylase, putative [Heliorestis convoluta]
MKRLLILTTALLILFALSFAAIYGGVALLDEYGIELGERAFDYDYVLKNGTIIDGTGGEIYQGDIALRKGKIRFIGIIEPPAHVQVIDATDLYILPGFVDLYSPADLDRAQGQDFEKLVQQGVTSVLAGFGELSSDHGISVLQRQGKNPWPVNRALVTGYKGLAEFLEPYDLFYDLDYGDALMEEHDFLYNSYQLAQNHGLVNYELQREVQKAMAAGAMGLYIDFDQAPGRKLTYDDVRILATILKEQDKVLILSMPLDPQDPVALLQRLIRLQEETEVTILLTPWDYLATAEESLVAVLTEILQEAQESQFIRMVFYPSATQGEGLRQPLQRAFARYPASMIEIVAVDGQNESNLIGKTLAEVAMERSSDVATTAQTLMARGSVQVVVRFFQPERYDRFIMSPYTFLTTHWDLSGRTDENPIFDYLHRQVGQGLVSWEEAAKKLSLEPASFLGLTDRGTIEVDQWADLTVIDPRLLSSYRNLPHQVQRDDILDMTDSTEATNLPSEDANQYPLRYLFVNGVLLYSEGQQVEQYPGRFLQRNR